MRRSFKKPPLPSHHHYHGTCHASILGIAGCLSPPSNSTQASFHLLVRPFVEGVAFGKRSSAQRSTSDIHPQKRPELIMVPYSVSKLFRIVNRWRDCELTAAEKDAMLGENGIMFTISNAGPVVDHAFPFLFHPGTLHGVRLTVCKIYRCKILSTPCMDAEVDMNRSSGISPAQSPISTGMFALFIHTVHHCTSMDCRQARGVPMLRMCVPKE